MPRHMYPDERGDLFVEYQIAMPSALTEQQQSGTAPFLTSNFNPISYSIRF